MNDYTLNVSAHILQAPTVKMFSQHTKKHLLIFLPLFALSLHALHMDTLSCKQ